MIEEEHTRGIKLLDNHAIRYRLNGLPIYGEPNEDGERSQIGVVSEPVWRMSNLTWAQGVELGRRVYAALDERDIRRPHDPYWTDDRVYRAVLENHGIVCPHPKHRQRPLRTPEAYECLVCRAYIMPLKIGEEVRL